MLNYTTYWLNAYNKLIEGQLGNIVYLFLIIKVEVEALLQLRQYFFRHNIIENIIFITVKLTNETDILLFLFAC